MLPIQNPLPVIKITLEMASAPYQFDPYSSKSFCKDGDYTLSIIPFGPFFAS
jgi:hypothetical protein